MKRLLLIFMLLAGPAFAVLQRDRTPDVNVFKHLNKAFPPTLFLVGETDGWRKSSDELVAELREKKQPVEVWMAGGLGHMYFGKEGWMTPTLLRIDAFLSGVGLLDGTPTLKAEGHALESVVRICEPVQ
jgi:acetyl esterase/lipase